MDRSELNISTGDEPLDPNLPLTDAVQASAIKHNGESQFEPSRDPGPHGGNEHGAAEASKAALCSADQHVVRVEEFLANHRIDILFDGAFRCRRAPSEAWGSIESRLAQSEPTEEGVLDEILLNAGRQGSPIRRTDAKVALRRVTRDARRRRIIDVGRHLFDSLNLKDEQDARAQWIELAAIFDGETDLFVAILKHFIWQVKRKLVHLDVHQHLMPIMTSAIQGSGKTTFVQKFLAPLDDLVADSVLLSDLVDPRSGDLFRFPVAFVDDVGSLDRRSIEVLKNVVTARRLTRRRLGTSSSTAIVQATTLIGTANRPIDELIADETGNRRFAMLPFRNGDEKKGGDKKVWAAINLMEPELLWRSVDEDARSPIEAFRPALHAWQEASRPKGEVEAWLVELDVASQPVTGITTAAGVKAQALYELFKLETGSDLSRSKFGTELPRLAASNPRVPFGAKAITRAGTFYPIKPMKSP